MNDLFLCIILKRIPLFINCTIIIKNKNMNQSPYYGNTNNPYGQAQNPQTNQTNQSRNSGNIATQAIQAASMARQNNLNPNI